MKKIFITIASAMIGLCAISCAASAQTKGAGTYNLQKAYETLSDTIEDTYDLANLKAYNKGIQNHL